MRTITIKQLKQFIMEAIQDNGDGQTIKDVETIKIRFFLEPGRSVNLLSIYNDYNNKTIFIDLGY